MVLLAVQAILLDSQTTMSLLDLKESRKNFAMYLIDKNGLSNVGHGASGVAGDAARDKVNGEMVKLLGKATRQQE
jgi:hypothetical protein